MSEKQELIELYEQQYQKLCVEIERLFGQWDYACILLNVLSFDNPTRETIFKDCDTIKEQIDFKSKMRDQVWEKLMVAKYGKDWRLENDD